MALGEGNNKRVVSNIIAEMEKIVQLISKLDIIAD